VALNGNACAGHDDYTLLFAWCIRVGCSPITKAGRWRQQKLSDRLAVHFLQRHDVGSQRNGKVPRSLPRGRVSREFVIPRRSPSHIPSCDDIVSHWIDWRCSLGLRRTGRHPYRGLLDMRRATGNNHEQRQPCTAPPRQQFG
jgi:hypothetical protein